MKYLFFIFLISSVFLFSCEENINVGFGSIRCPEGQTAIIEDGEAICVCKNGNYLDEGVCVNPCKTQTCSGHGVCNSTSLTDIECSCYEGYYNSDKLFCINPCDNKCSGHGACLATNLTDAKCVCDDGYFSNNTLGCIDPCENNCSGHGVCSATSLTDAKCVCNDGFEENNVDCVDINECDGDPCIENETCKNTIGSYECFCGDGFLEKGNLCIPQSTYQQWGTSSFDKAEEMIIDSSGNIYITGSTEGNFDGSGNNGAKDVFLMKLDSNNTLKWKKQWGTTSNEEAFGINVDSNDNIYITGYTNGTMGSSSKDSEDIFMIKVKSDGITEWIKQWGTNDIDVGYAIAIDSDNNIYVTGKIDGDNVPMGTDQTDMFLSKFNTDGERAWTKVWGGNKHDVSKTLVVDSSGDIYIAGWSEELLGGSTGGRDIFILKSNSDGVEYWRTRWGTSGTDEAKNLLIDADDNLYATGFTTGTLDVKVGKDDIFVSKINTDDGARLWTKQFGTTKDDNSKNINIYNNKLYIVGTTEVTNRKKDILLTQLDTDGITQWSKNLGTTSEDLAESLAITDGVIYVTGSTTGDLGDANFGEEDIFLMNFLIE